MKRVTMTLSCPPTCDNHVGILHFRPAGTLSVVCSLFKNTEIRILRDKHNCPADFLARCPTGVVDPKAFWLLTMACFKHGEEVGLEVSGQNEDLAVALVKTAFEHSGLQREELLACLIRAGEMIEDPDRTAILAEATRDLSPSCGSMVVARLNRRLHGLAVSIFPELARYFDCSVVLLYQTRSGLIQQRHISANDYVVVGDLLSDMPDEGTLITIGAEGQRWKEAIEAFRGVIERFGEIEYWIRRRGANVRDPSLLQEVLNIAGVGAGKSVGAKPSSHVHTLLNRNSIILSEATCSKERVIQELSMVLASRSQISNVTIEDSVWDREERYATLVAEGLAVPHAHLEGTEGVQLAMGIYRRGIDWGAGDQFRRAGVNTAYVVLMFLTGPDVRDEYIHYLAQVTRLFHDTPQLVEQLRNAQSISQSLTVIRTAENQLSQA
jgi:PTS system nitrogen regulatory IIA component